MKNNLKNRYIYAVTRHLPAKMQKDVERELDSLITEMAEERLAGSTADWNSNDPQPKTTTHSEEIIKDVLAELGSPEELALKYNGGGQTALISGVYFLMYKRVLRVALPIVAAVSAILAAVGIFAGFGSEINIVIGNIHLLPLDFFVNLLNILANSFSAVAQAFMIITFIFAILDYGKVNLKDGELSELPNVPEEDSRVSLPGAIAEIVFTIAGVAVFLMFPHFIGGSFGDGVWIPVFNVELLQGELWFHILAWGVVSVGVIFYQLAVGQYTMKVVTVSVASNIILAALTVMILGSSSIVNPEFASHLADILGESFYWAIEHIISRPNQILIAVICIGLLIDTIEVVYKGFQGRRG